MCAHRHTHTHTYPCWLSSWSVETWYSKKWSSNFATVVNTHTDRHTHTHTHTHVQWSCSFILMYSCSVVCWSDINPSLFFLALPSKDEYLFQFKLHRILVYSNVQITNRWWLAVNEWFWRPMIDKGNSDMGEISRIAGHSAAGGHAGEVLLTGTWWEGWGWLAQTTAPALSSPPW